MQKPQKGPKFRRKEKKEGTDNRTLAERIISQRGSASQEFSNDPQHNGAKGDDNQQREENYSDNRGDLSPCESVDISHITETEIHSPTPQPTFSEIRQDSATEADNEHPQQTTNTNDGTQSHKEPQEPVTTSDSPSPGHTNDDKNESETLKDNKRKDTQERSRTSSANSARRQSANRNHSNATTEDTNNTNISNSDDEKKDNNDKDNAGGKVSANSSPRKSSQSETRSETSMQNSSNQQNNSSEYSINGSVNDNDRSSPARLSETLNKSNSSEHLQEAVVSSDSSVEVGANEKNYEISLQDSDDQISEDPKEPSRSSDVALAGSSLPADPKATKEETPTESNGQNLEDLPKEDSTQSSSPAENDKELHKSHTFVKDRKDAIENKENSSPENELIAKFVNNDVDTMDSIETDACIKTLEEMVDQSLNSLVSREKEEPKVSPINEELKNKVLGEDFQKKINDFLNNI